MIGGEHRKERLSERLEGAQNQPKNRGYLPGTEVKSGGYTPNTLAGNWFEERADAAYYDGQAVLPTENAKLWTTTYREMVKPVAQSAAVKGSMAPQPRDSFDQATMMEIVDRTQSSYPGHQPHLDADREQSTGPAVMQTVSQQTYVAPQVAEAAQRAFVPPVLGGTPGAQARGVLLRLRRQLELAMPNKSAFPGNVIRSVRNALLANVGSGTATYTKGCGVPEVNAQELLAGLAEVGLDASDPECVALIRSFDKTGNGTAPVPVLVDKLRGEPTERRLQLIANVYRLLASIAAAEGASGRGDGLVHLQQLIELIDVHQLPDVASGAVSADDALAAFASQWESFSLHGAFSRSCGPPKGGSGDSSALVSESAFADYFSDASFEVAGEGEFEVMMRNMWHLSGGNGKWENTSCRRLEVIHLNGRVTREEVKDDLAIKGSSDTPEVDLLIRANLSKQGIKDVKSYRVL